MGRYQLVNFTNLKKSLLKAFYSDASIAKKRFLKIKKNPQKIKDHKSKQQQQVAAKHAKHF